MKRAKPSAKKRIGRPPGRRPVLALRIDQSMYDDIQRTSKEAGRTMAEETIRRLHRYDEYVDGFGDVKKWQAEARRTIERGVDAALTHKGFRKVAGRELWIGPGELEETYIALNPQLDTVIERAVMLALQKVKDQ